MEFVFDTTGAHQSGGPGMLVLCLERTYHAGGTNGSLTLDGKEICKTIELPWRDNRRNVSCIPEGRYRLGLYPSRKFGLNLLVQDVPGRSGILIHPANNAAAELRGCIAPVTKLTGAGCGIYSRIALERLLGLVEPALEAGEAVWLEVVGASKRSKN